MSATPFVLSIGQFTRPADTTAYAANDLVANSTTAGSVVPLSASVRRGGISPLLQITRAKVRTNHTTLTNGTFRVHFYDENPGTPSNGDNGAHRLNTVYDRGYIEVTLTNVGSTGQFGAAAPTVPIMVRPASGTLYVTIEATAAYVPASEETFRVDIEGFIYE